MRVFGISQKTKARLLVVIGLLAILAIARYGGMEESQVVTGYLKAVERVETKDRIVALTFDVSWGETVPLQVLDALKKYGVRCTFFLSGPWAHSHPEVVKRMQKDGHEIASHGYRHIRLTRYSRDVISEEIAKTHAILHEITGIEPSLFRPPDGDLNDTVISVALEQNYMTVLWSMDSRDLQKPGHELTVRRVLRRAKPGDIILFHASDSAPDTPLALPGIIEGLLKAKIQMDTVSGLLDSSID